MSRKSTKSHSRGPSLPVDADEAHEPHDPRINAAVRLARMIVDLGEGFSSAQRSCLGTSMALFPSDDVEPGEALSAALQALPEKRSEDFYNRVSTLVTARIQRRFGASPILLGEWISECASVLDDDELKKRKQR